MNDCIIYNISQYIDDLSFLKSISITCKNDYFTAKRKQIMKTFQRKHTKYVIDTNFIFCDVRIAIFKARRSQNVIDYIMEIIKEMSDLLLLRYNICDILTCNKSIFPKEGQCVSIKQNLNYSNLILNKFTILTILYENESKICNNVFISTIYRMSRYNTDILKRHFRYMARLLMF